MDTLQGLKTFKKIVYKSILNKDSLEDIATDSHTLDVLKNKKDEIFNETLEALDSSTVFEIDDKLKKLLLLTDPPKDLDKGLLKLPYDKVFLSVSLDKDDGIEDEEIEGVLVMNPSGDLVSPDMGMINPTVDRVNKMFRVLYDGEEFVHVWNGMTVSFSKEDDKWWINTHTWVVDRKEDVIGVKVLRDKKKQHQILKRLITNFILFLSQPDVQTIYTHRSDKNRERNLKRGQLPLPDTVRIQVRGETKRYIEELEKRGYLWKGYSHRFKVRAHWRRLDGDHFTLKKGQRIWIPPSIKGEGMLIPKTYKLTAGKDEKQVA